MKKLEISMAKYDEKGKPIEVAYGIYKIADVEMFRREGYVDVSRDLAVKIDEELASRHIIHESPKS